MVSFKWPCATVAKLLTKRSFLCRIERMYEVERFSTSRQSRAGARLVSDVLDSRPVQLEAGWEKPGEGNPNDPGQARSQEHARWWGYCWFQG